MTRHRVTQPEGDGASRRSVLKYGAGVAGTTVALGGLSGSAAALDVSERAKLVPADGTYNSEFGHALAVDQAGSTVLVGAPGATTEQGEEAGAAYVFTRHGDDHAQTAKLLPEEGEPEDRFGTAVALDATGRTALVGQQRDDGEGSDGAYIFERRQSEWVQTAAWSPADREGLLVQDFGAAVSLDASGRTAAVGAPGSADLGFHAGVLFVTERDDDGWSDLQALHHSYGEDAFYGSAVDLAASGNAGAVGAPVARPAQDPIRGGFVHVLRRTRDEWRQPTLLQADTAEDVDKLGTAVACDAACRTIVAGRAGEDDGDARDRGGAVVFRRTPRGWGQAATLPYSGGENDRFGDAAAIDDHGRIALVGAPGRDTDAGTDAGQAVLYVRGGDSWSREVTVAPSDAASDDRFGAAVALDAAGRTGVVGAPDADDGNVGAAYVFTRS